MHVPERELGNCLEDVVRAMSEPMGSHDVAAFYLLSQQTSQYVKVVQSGQGADEVFAGYDYYQPLRLVARGDAATAFQRSFADLPDAEIRSALNPELRLNRDVSLELIGAAMAEPGAETALDAALRLELTHLMPDDPVKRVDNMSMAWGVEARVPFLDHELVELAAACPPGLKLAQGGKAILKDIARPLLPDGLVDRPKGYFPVPSLSLVEGELLTRVTELLRSPEAKQRGLFDAGYVDGLLADAAARNRSGRRDQLWQLAVLELWLQEHGIS
jgi:asparagine synthase (glutamine-hydrolysing)